MLTDITLGQYFPGNSLLHRLDPRTKIILLFIFIVGIFIFDTPSKSSMVAILVLGREAKFARF